MVIRRIATNVAPSNRLTAIKPVTLSRGDVTLAREFILFAAESMRVILSDEERYAAKEGYERPIVASLRAYITDAHALLTRLT